MKWLVLVGEVAYDLARDAWRERKRRKAAAKAWAEQPAPVRACPSCREVAYTPGQLSCLRCGSRL
jgi:hypothetical protein